MVVSEPLSTRRTLSNTTLSPTAKAPDSFSTFNTSPTATLYCLPPVSITANSFIGHILHKNLKKGKSRGILGGMIFTYKYKGLSWINLEAPSPAEQSMAEESLNTDHTIDEIISKFSSDGKLEGKSSLSSFIIPILTYDELAQNVSPENIYFIHTPNTIVTVSSKSKGLFTNVAKKVEKVAFSNMENSLENPHLFILFLVENLINENTNFLAKLNKEATRTNSRKIRILNTVIILLIIGLAAMFYFLQ